jgi:hypothetical protein
LVAVLSLDNYHCLYVIIVTELGRRETRKLNIASLITWIQLLTRIVVLDLQTIYSMVKARLLEVNCPLISTKGYSHYGEG